MGGVTVFISDAGYNIHASTDQFTFASNFVYSYPATRETKVFFTSYQLYMHAGAHNEV